MFEPSLRLRECGLVAERCAFDLRLRERLCAEDRTHRCHEVLLHARVHRISRDAHALKKGLGRAAEPYAVRHTDGSTRRGGERIDANQGPWTSSGDGTPTVKKGATPSADMTKARGYSLGLVPTK